MTDITMNYEKIDQYKYGYKCKKMFEISKYCKVLCYN